jgi:hypothetical protein
MFNQGRQCTILDVLIDAAALIFAMVVVKVWSLRQAGSPG